MPFFDHLKQWLFKNYNWLLRNAVKSGHKWQHISPCKRASDASLLLWEGKVGGLKTISYTVHLLTKQTASLQKEHFLFAFLRIKTFLNSKASYKLLHIIVVHMGFGIQEQLWNLVSVFVLVASGHDSPMTSPERDDHRISLIKLDGYRALMLPWRRTADNHINTCVLDSPLSTSGDTQFTGKDKRGWLRGLGLASSLDSIEPQWFSSADRENVKDRGEVWILESPVRQRTRTRTFTARDLLHEIEASKAHEFQNSDMLTTNRYFHHYFEIPSMFRENWFQDHRSYLNLQKSNAHTEKHESTLNCKYSHTPQLMISEQMVWHHLLPDFKIKY